jgi:hypothetical protein
MCVPPNPRSTWYGYQVSSQNSLQTWSSQGSEVLTAGIRQVRAAAVRRSCSSPQLPLCSWAMTLGWMGRLPEAADGTVRDAQLPMTSSAQSVESNDRPGVSTCLVRDHTTLVCLMQSARTG